jgi:hypothetical protein
MSSPVRASIRDTPVSVELNGRGECADNVFRRVSAVQGAGKSATEKQYYTVSNYLKGTQTLEVPRGERFVRIATVGGKTLVDMQDWAHEELPEEIDVLCAFGLVELRLPADIRIELRGAGLFGAFGGNARHTHPIPGPPVIVRGLVGFGGVEARVPFVT